MTDRLLMRLSCNDGVIMDISQYFMNGDVRGAISYMRGHTGFEDVLPAYISVFEKGEFISYDVPSEVNDILRFYQVYFRDVFYLGVGEDEASGKLLTKLRNYLSLPDADESLLEERLRKVFEDAGLHALFGKTQGHYGPYVWKETVPAVWNVALPGGSAEYRVNILRGFIFRSWMDYLTFGRFGTGGWASPDGTINCIEKAYDFESERFLISLLKHEAQHAVDMKQFPGITPTELEYRAKLVELHYSHDPELLGKFLRQAENASERDSHAMASARIRKEFAGTDQQVSERALELFNAHTAEMRAKYGV